MADTEEARRFKQPHRSFVTAELSDERAQAIGSSRMDERHAHLDALLEPARSNERMRGITATRAKPQL